MEGFGKTTRYFSKFVLRKRPYIKPEWIEQARKYNVIVKETQPDGRATVWLHIPEENQYLKVVFLKYGEILHNAFFDRSLKAGGSEERLDTIITVRSHYYPKIDTLYIEFNEAASVEFRKDLMEWLLITMKTVKSLG